MVTDDRESRPPAPKISFTESDTDHPLPKWLFTPVHNVATTNHYIKLMDRIGRVTFSSRRGFVSLYSKDALDTDSVEKAASLIITMVKKTYPRKYQDKQLVSANMLKKLIRDAAKKTPKKMTWEEGAQITQDTLRCATTHPSVFSSLWDPNSQQMSNQHNGANFWMAAISEYGSLFYHKQKEIEQHTTLLQTAPPNPKKREVPLLRYDTPIEQVLEERLKAAAQAEAR